MCIIIRLNQNQLILQTGNSSTNWATMLPGWVLSDINRYNLVMYDCTYFKKDILMFASCKTDWILVIVAKFGKLWRKNQVDH